MNSEATALAFPFDGLTRTPNSQYQGRKTDFCGQNRLFPDIFSTEANNQYQNVIIIVVVIVVVVVAVVIITLQLVI